MTKLLPQQPGACRPMAANDNDGFCDTAPPKPAAQRRGHKLVIAFMLLAGLAALGVGLAQGVQGVRAAFPAPSALLQAEAWGRFFEALGQIGTVGLIVVGVIVLWRVVIRRRRT